jgi:hypothetical protein
MNESKVILKEKENDSKHASRLVKAFEDWKNLPDSFSQKPNGVFGSVAIVRCENVTVKSEELDLEYSVPFDDDLEPNEAEIIIYNLADSTIKQLNHRSEISIEAGYVGDTGVIFKGFIDRVRTKYEGADKITTIKALDDVENHTVESLSFAAGTTASSILRTLIDKTGLPVAVISIRRDHTYENEQTVDGDLMEAISKYSEVCGVSTYTLKGKVYCRHIKEGDNINFTVEEETGMIGSPSEYEEEVTAEDYKDIINGYEIEMLLQHRMQTAAIINLKSLIAKGQYRVRSGEHTFDGLSAITKIKVM